MHMGHMRICIIFMVMASILSMMWTPFHRHLSELPPL